MNNFSFKDTIVYRSLRYTGNRLIKTFFRDLNDKDFAFMVGIIVFSFIFSVLIGDVVGENTFNELVWKTLLFIFIFDAIPFVLREMKIKKKEAHYRKNTAEVFSVIRELEQEDRTVKELTTLSKTVYKTNDDAYNDYERTIHQLKKHFESKGEEALHSDKDVLNFFQNVNQNSNNLVRKINEIVQCPHYDVNPHVESWVLEQASPVIRSLQANVSNFQRMYEEYSNSRFAIKSGVEGELSVQRILSEFSNTLNPVYGARFKSENGTVENDVLLFTKQGIFSLEVKNIGQNGSKKVKITNDGLWYEWKYEKWVKSDKNRIFDQVNRHTALTEKLFNDQYGLKGNHIVKSMIVIPNNNIEIINESAFIIVRPNQIVSIVRSFSDILSETEQLKLKTFIEEQDIGQGKFEHLDAKHRVSQLIHHYDVIREQYDFLTKVARIQEIYVEHVNNDNLSELIHLKQLNLHMKRSVL